jgi:hypothetical protein
MGQKSLASLLPILGLLGIWLTAAVAATAPAMDGGLLEATYSLAPEPSAESLLIAGIVAIAWLNRQRRSRVVV